MNMYYILDEGGNPVSATVEQWGYWLEDAGILRMVDFTQIGEIEISTVFVGLNPHPTSDQKPKLYETAISGGLLDGHSWKYSTKQDAIDGHRQALREVRKTMTRTPP